MTTPTVFTLEELASHNQPDDLWIAVDGKVYDVTRYTELHPGGVQILRGAGGTNATAAFHDVGHSEDALETLQTYLVGTMEQTEEIRARPVFKSRMVPPPPARTKRNLGVYLTKSIAALKHALGLISVIVAAKILWPERTGLSTLSMAIDAVSSFWKGVMLSSAASGVVLCIVGSEISKSLDMTEGLRRYPPVTKPTKALRGPLDRASRRINALDPVQFRSFVLTERTQLTSNTYRLILQVHDAQSESLSCIPAGQHVQIRAEMENAPVLRSYTPTGMDSKTGRMELTVKVYPGGKMGNHLLRLPTGALVDVRGPIGHFKGYHRFLCSHVAMIAGGTGITPMWQIIRAICQDLADDTCVTLLYANQTQADILLRDEIDALAARFPHKLKVHYFVSADQDPSWTGERGRITATRLAQLLPAVTGTSKYLVCGPDPMVLQVTQDLLSLGCESPKAFKHATDQVFVF